VCVAPRVSSDSFNIGIAIVKDCRILRDSIFQRCLLGLALLIIYTLSSSNSSAQTLQERLEQQTAFIPQNSSPAEQLIAVAQRFKIPMAIEWLEQKSDQSKPSLNFKNGSVLDLIKAIIKQSPEHQLLNEGRILYIYPPSVAAHQFNFLNLRLDNYEVNEESLLGAEFELRISINAKLYPELYKNGYNGGYGSDPDDVFWKKSITFSGNGMTIREILNRIAEENGNALWIVKINSDEFAGDKPKWVGVPIDEHGSSPLDSRWRFIPLSEERTDSTRKP
jgi:hypothetical protein